MKFKKKKIKIWIIVVLVIVVAIVLVIFNPFKKEISFQIKDSCGPIVNMISHTVQNEQVCETRCMSQCETKELKYSKVEFEFNPIGCHNCICYCR